MITDPNRKGDIAEMKAIVWLLEQEYEVYHNVGCTGKVDMVAIKEGETLLIDVKLLKTNKLGQLSFRNTDHEEQRKRGVRFLYVVGDTVGWNRDYFICDNIR